MPFDGIFAKYISNELNSILKGGRISKIHQPDKEAVVIQVRANGENYRLFLTSNAASSRIHLTEKQFENPDTPPVFCMLLRKHLMGGIIKGFFTNGFERIITMEAEVMDELGDLASKKLVIEVMGRHSNIILLNSSDKIIDSIKHVGFEVNRIREVLPARTYILPPAQEKLDPTDSSTFNVLRREAPSCGRKTESFLLDRLKGFSPTLCREIVHRAGIDDTKPANELTVQETERLINELENMMRSLENNGPTPVIVYEEGTNKPVDYHCVTLKQFNSAESFALLSQAIDSFYSQKYSREFNNQRARDLKNLVEKHLEKCEKRLDINLNTYEESKHYEKYRLFGELITANIYALSKGMEKALVVNYYDPDGQSIEIPLDKNKSPQENAKNYFKKYNKAKTAFVYSGKEIEALKQEIAYLESVLYAIENAENTTQLNEIRLELYEQGYAKQPMTKGKKVAPSPVAPLKIVSSDGFEILIGRSNKENDKLTLKMARHEDIWLHTKNVPGSHVVIRTEGKEVPPNTLLEAAQYAAWFSKARNTSKIEVDYTFVRNVKKPSGAKPGMVIYTNYNTIVASPKAPESEISD